MKKIYFLSILLSLTVNNIFAQIPPVITQEPDLSPQVCEGDNITISITATNALTYQWEVYSSFVGGWNAINAITIGILKTALSADNLDITGFDSPNLVISNADNLMDSLQLRCNAIGLDGMAVASVTSTEPYLTVNALPYVDRETSILRGCEIGDIDLVMSNLNPFDLITCQYDLYRGVDTVFALNDGNPLSILNNFPFSVDTGGQYIFAVINKDNPACERRDTINAAVQYVFEEEQISLVTFDPSLGKNIVVWNKTDSVGTDSFKIYGGASALGNNLFDSLTIFVDPTTPGGQAAQYSMEVIDSCGHISLPSIVHEAMLMTMDTVGGGVTLGWNDYVGFLYSMFYIHRGPDPLTLDDAIYIVDSVANGAGINSWTDLVPPSADTTLYYMISVALPSVVDILGGKKSNSGPFSRSLSNLEDNRQQGYDPNNIKSIKNNTTNFSVYPNPFGNQATVNYQLNNSSNVRLDVVNILGQKVLEMVDEKQGNGNYNYTISKNQLSGSGMYFINLWVDNIPYSKKIIVE